MGLLRPLGGCRCPTPQNNVITPELPQETASFKSSFALFSGTCADVSVSTYKSYKACHLALIHAFSEEPESWLHLVKVDDHGLMGADMTDTAHMKGVKEGLMHSLDGCGAHCIHRFIYFSSGLV